VPVFVPFETIILFSKQSVGEFNIAGGDSRTRRVIGLAPS